MLSDTFATSVDVSDPADVSPPAVTSSDTAYGTSTATARLSTDQAGDLIVALVSAGGSTKNSQTASVTGGGLKWTLVSRADARAGSAEVWVARAKRVLSRTQITATMSRSGFGVYLTVEAVADAAGTGATTGESGATGAPSATLVTDFGNSYVLAVGNDPTAAKQRIAGPGQKLLGEATVSGNTFWVQASKVITTFAGTSVTINDKAPANDQWNLAVVSLH